MKPPNRIVIATRNRGKVHEIRSLLEGLPIELLSLADFPNAPEITEDRPTFEENACKKARVISAYTGAPALADDSGLCVDALGGRPGVHSARYGGEGLSDLEKCTRLLSEIKAQSNPVRTAGFVCVLALAFPSGREEIFRGECFGLISDTARGSGGFGYDPIFFHPQTGLTFAEMDASTKNRESHRGAALRRFALFLGHIEENSSGPRPC